MTMQETSLAPVQQSQRIVIVDILRGWALLGVVLMNYVDYYYLGMDWQKFKGDILTNVLMGTGQIFFSAKSWTMLTVLFGYGFSVLMQNVSAKGLSPNAFFMRRMFWLLVLAVINSAFFFGDILKDYAVMGMIMLLFRKISAKQALYTSIAVMAVVPLVVALVNMMGHSNGMKLLEPHIPLFQSHNPLKVLWFGLYGTVLYEFFNYGYLISVHVLMLSLMLFGMAIHKSGFLVNLQENKKRVKKIMWWSLGTTLFLIAVFITSQQLKLNWMKYYAPFYFMIVATMIFIATLLCFLYQRGVLKNFFNMSRNGESRASPRASISASSTSP